MPWRSQNNINLVLAFVAPLYCFLIQTELRSTLCYISKLLVNYYTFKGPSFVQTKFVMMKVVPGFVCVFVVRI